jgi:hypothetical protein
VRLLAALAAAMPAVVGCTTLGDDLAPRLPDAAIADAWVIEPDTGIAGPDAAADAAADAGDASDAGVGDAAAADALPAFDANTDAPAAAQQW